MGQTTSASISGDWRAKTHLGEGVLQVGNGREDLGDTNEDVRSGYDPNIEWGRVWRTIFLGTR